MSPLIPLAPTARSGNRHSSQPQIVMIQGSGEGLCKKVTWDLLSAAS
jgi:hypothetical protein